MAPEPSQVPTEHSSGLDFFEALSQLSGLSPPAGPPPPSPPDSRSSTSSESTPSFYRLPLGPTPSPGPTVPPATADIGLNATVSMAGRIPVITLGDDAATPAQSERRPGLGPDWAGILNNLTQRQLDELNAQATQAALHPDDPDIQIVLPPRATSDDPEDPEGEDDPQQSDDAQEDPSEQEEDQGEMDSILGFLNNREAAPVTPDHHPDFRPPSPITAPVEDHRAKSIMTSGAMTYIPREARGHFEVTPRSRILDETVDNLTAIGVLKPAKFVSAYRLFVHAKPDLRVRVLYDLSPLTPYLTRPHCRLPRSLDLLGDSDARFAIKIDLADGFFQIPIHKGLQPFLGVRYGSRSYVWTVLPMGLATAPSLMQTVMGAIAKLITRCCPGVKARVYLDDFLFTAPAPALLTPIPELLRSWGLKLNDRKSQLLPCRQLTYLGISLDLAERRLFVPDQTRDRV